MPLAAMASASTALGLAHQVFDIRSFNLHTPVTLHMTDLFQFDLTMLAARL